MQTCKSTRATTPKDTPLSFSPCARTRFFIASLR